MALLQNISNWLLVKKESSVTDRKFIAWNEIKSVFIVTQDNQLSEIVDFVTNCENANKKVKVAVIYNGKPEHAPKPPFNHVILNKKQFSFFNLVKDTFIQSMNHETYDILVNLGKKEDIKSLSISKAVKASCKIANFNHPIFDMSIDVDKSSNSHQFLKQVMVYLQMIKTA